MWPDWAIYLNLGNFLKPLATINLPKSSTFLGNFCKGVKIYHFPSKIIFGQLLLIFGDFFLVTLILTELLSFYVRPHFSIFTWVCFLHVHDMYVSFPVWPDLAKFTAPWRKFTSLWQIFYCSFPIRQNADPIWQICDIIGLVFIVAKGQILKNKLAIWSHCSFPLPSVIYSISPHISFTLFSFVFLL